ncbi:MAG: bifunctional diguanylate cyclase/phosphodiesterase, partial [Acidimicrobiaceae bacterium]|nr:bifunctional diguanylate cyclase/phosphodiesterase [Acidimicrobiaceae bacterium]
KRVNDTLGHKVGDELLVAVSHRLETVSRATNTLGRFGGDEFLYLAEGLTSPGEAEEVAKRILSVFIEPFQLAKMRVNQCASIGIAIFSADSENVTEIIQDADIALYEAKRQGKSRYTLFSRDMQEAISIDFELAREMKLALSSGEFSIYYQPIIDLATTEVVGFEALLRWNHPVRGMVPPQEFIAIAEQRDLIFDLGTFALRQAISDAGSWESVGARAKPLFVAVNLAPRQFYDPNLTIEIEDMLNASGFPSSRLILEITESVAFTDISLCARVIAHLRQLGVSIALDDFGTGYSSLTCLSLLDTGIVKIDESFVRPAQENQYSKDLMEATVSFCHKLDMTVLAEGIEDQEQLEHLRSLGCDLGQGHLFSPAISAREVAAWLTRTA